MSYSNDDSMNVIDHLANWFTLPKLIFAIGLTFFLVGIIFPFYWMVSSSFKTYAEIGGREPVYVPSALRLDAYKELFDPNNPSYQNFGTNILNSIKVAIPASIIAVILSTLGAYAITRLYFRGKDIMLNSILLMFIQSHSSNFL